MNSVNRDIALKLAQMEIHVFPCTPEKVPVWKDWEHNATNSALKIEATWQSNPQYLPAIPVGAHGLLVIDCDRKNGKDGVAALTALCAECGIDLSRTLAVETPSGGGVHVYFRTDLRFGNSRGSLPDGIDIRASGGFAIAPGAILPDGRGYRIVQGSWDSIAALPEPLATLLREKKPPTPSTPAAAPVAATERERAYAAGAVADAIGKLSVMRDGEGRNDALNKAALSLGTLVGAGWIDRQTVEQALWEASERNGYRAKDGDDAARKTLRSGLESGIAKPREPLPTGDSSNLNVSAMIANGTKQSVVAKPAQSKRTVSLIFGTEIKERAISWLWDQYLPMGSLILLSGPGGVGKSTITCDITARVTTGREWPDGSPCRKPGKVIIWSSEDEPEAVIKPRLIAAGADPRNYAVIGPTLDERGQSSPFDPANDMEPLREAVERIGGISLLVIDPIVSAVTGDMNKANEVRRSLSTVVDFAMKTGCSVLGITHFAKGTAGRNAAERVIGSTAFKDYSRVTLAVVKSEDSGEHVFTRAKSNYSSEGGGFSFSIEVGQLPSGISTSRVAWGKALEGSSRSILAAIEGDGSQDGDKMHAAKRFLIELLNQGPVPSKDVLKQAREGYGITEDTLRRAYSEIGVKPFRVGGMGSLGHWMWALPMTEPSR